MRKYIRTRKPGLSGNRSKIMLDVLEKGLMKAIELANFDKGFQGMAIRIRNNLKVIREVGR